MNTTQQLSTNDEWGSTVWSCNHMKGIVDCTAQFIALIYAKRRWLTLTEKLQREKAEMSLICTTIELPPLVTVRPNLFKFILVSEDYNK